MNFPVQLRNVTFLPTEERFFISGETPLVTIQVCLSSTILLPHPRAEAHSIPNQYSNNFVDLQVEMYPFQDSSYSIAISKTARYPRVLDHAPRRKRHWLKLCTRKMLLKVLFQDCQFGPQPKSTKASLKHRADQGNAAGMIFSRLL